MVTRFVNDVKKYFKYALYSCRAQLKAEVAGSYLNWAWWILEPLCFMVIYAVVFDVIFGAREEYFTAFIFIGISVWNFFNKNVKQSVKLVKNNKAIITKVYTPKYVLVISKLMVNGFKMLISFGIVVLLMIILQVPVTWNVLFIIPILIDICLFTFGVMCIMTHFGVFVEDLANVTDILLKFIFYFTGVMYDIDHRIGKTYPVASVILEKCNPLAFFITAARDGLLYSTTPEWELLIVWFVISLIISMIGVNLIYKNENGYAKVI